ncbi:MAG: hypothetical protein AMXMBFR13_07640 [Phycisphaerae bacterium]
MVALSVLLSGAVGAVAVEPVGTAVSYQGRLNQNGLPMNGNVDFQFRLYDEAVAGTQIGPVVQHASVPLDGGVFHVPLDFGPGAFPGGQARWLEVDVRHPTGAGPFTTLLPRQELTPVPYAVGLSLPYRGILDSDGLAGGVFEILNNGVGWAGVFRNNNPANADPALNVTSMGGPAGGFLNDGGGTALRATSPQGGVAVEAESPGFGVDAKAVHARITSQNAGAMSAAVRGEHQADAAQMIGVWGSSAGAGWGVLGQSGSGTGVRGEVIGVPESGSYGVHGLHVGARGIGVRGEGSSTGVHGTATDPDGIAMLGEAGGTVGEGVRGEGFTGVYGIATGRGGVNYGVRGSTASIDGFAGYFTGPAGSKNYFERNVGIGTTNPNHELVVQGNDPVMQIRDDTVDNSANAARLELLERAGGTFNGGAFLHWNGQTDKLLVGTKDGGVNTNVLVIDRATSRVGIGTQDPGNRLSVNGVADFSSRVGIGTPNPNHELVIQGDDPAMQIRDDTTNNSPNAARLELLERADGNFDGGAFLAWNGEINKLLIGTKDGGTNTNVLVIDRATSSVGIGTQVPGDYRLAVNGSVRAKEIVVETGWSDFVFEPDYELPSLEEVENYIKKHGHLPDVPSAVQVEEHGVKVGEMHSRLLQKIEEMTLHMIDMNKRMNALERENQALRNQVKAWTAGERSVD